MNTLPHSPAKLSIGYLFGMCLLMLGANVVWVSYNSVLLPTLVEKVDPENKGLIVGLTGFFGTLLAITVSLLWGIISDHTTNRWGKRTPAILAGSLVALPLIGMPAILLAPALREILLPVALPIILISYLGMQFSTNVGNGAWWPLLVDIVPENQRGAAAGIQGFLTMLGAAIGIILITVLNQNGQTGLALWMIGGVFAITGIINALVLRGRDKSAEVSQRIGLWKAMQNMFRVRTRVGIFFWLVFALLLANMGFSSMQFFARYFFEVYFPFISPDSGFRIMGGISLVVTMLASVGAGFISDKIGRRPLILWATFICAITTLMMGLTDNFAFFLTLTAIRSVAIGPIIATAPALASDLAPRDEAGQYMAYNNLSTSLSSALSSLIFGIILISMTKITFMMVFIVSAILFLLGWFVFLIKVPQKGLDARMKALR